MKRVTVKEVLKYGVFAYVPAKQRKIAYVGLFCAVLAKEILVECAKKGKKRNT